MKVILPLSALVQILNKSIKAQQMSIWFDFLLNNHLRSLFFCSVHGSVRHSINNYCHRNNPMGIRSVCGLNQIVSHLGWSYELMMVHPGTFSGMPASLGSSVC